MRKIKSVKEANMLPSPHGCHTFVRASLRPLSGRPLARVLLVGLALMTPVMVMAACSASTPSTPTPQFDSTRMVALLKGEVILEDGCLRVGLKNGERRQLVWPPDIIVKIEQDTIQIDDLMTGDKAVWRVGEQVEVGGGGLSAPDEQRHQKVPANCPGPYWLVGGVGLPTPVSPKITPP